jgi:hypothetical protein
MNIGTEGEKKKYTENFDGENREGMTKVGYTY